MWYPLISAHHYHHQHPNLVPSRSYMPATTTTNNNSITTSAYASRMRSESFHARSTTPPREEQYYPQRCLSSDHAQPATPQRHPPYRTWSSTSPTEREAHDHHQAAQRSPSQALTPLNRLNISQSVLPPWRRQPSAFWMSSSPGAFKPWPEPRSLYAQEQPPLTPLKTSVDAQKKFVHATSLPAHAKFSGVFIDSAKANLDRMAAYTNTIPRSHEQAPVWKGKARMRSPPPPPPAAALSPPASLLPPPSRSRVHPTEQMRRTSLASAASSASTIPNVLQLTTNNQNVFASSRTRQHASYMVNSRKTSFELQATSHECFTMVGGKWTCYRRNYLKIDAVAKPMIAIERKARDAKTTIYDPVTDTHYRKRSRSTSISSDSDSSLSPALSSATTCERAGRGGKSTPELFMTLTAHVANHRGEVAPQASEVNLVQFGPERERGTRTSVQPHRITAGGSLSTSGGTSGAAAAENASNVATFRRVQVRRATSKNGRLGDEAEQQYFILRMSLYTPSTSGLSIVRDEHGIETAPSRHRDHPMDGPPPAKRPRRNTSSLGAASAGPSIPTGDHAEGTSSSSSVHPQMVLLASLDSAPVTIRGRSRKHFAANVDPGSTPTPIRMQRS